MKRYLVFAGECYYPNGGFDDFQKDYDTADEAIAAARAYSDNNSCVWSHVYDLKTRIKIWSDE